VDVAVGITVGVGRIIGKIDGLAVDMLMV